MTPSRNNLITVGDCCIDHYENLGWFPGGNALNVAVAWRQLGVASRYVGAVGEDEAGSWMLTQIEAAGLDTSWVSRLPGPTGLTEIRLDADGERRILTEHLGVSGDFSIPEDLDLGQVDWVHGALSPSAADLVHRFRTDGAGISFDFSTSRTTRGLEGLDVAFYSWDGPPSPETDDFLEIVLQGGARLAVAMCGRYGSRARTTDQQVSVVGNRIKPVDTCGAGDAYIASFVRTHLAGAGLEEAMRAGSQAGEAACQRLGAWSLGMERVG